MKESVRKVLMVVMAAGFLIGLAILLYPLFSNMWNQYNADLRFEEYQIEAAERTRDESLSDEWEKAYAYNEELSPIIIPDSFIQAEAEKEDTAYMSCLNLKGDGVMGYISIPKIEQKIPIYHTSSEETLQKGAGHIQGSSLPVGGESTHAALAAHRGIPGASLFTDIDQLVQGDQFYLYILDDVLAYEIDQILTVMPEETEALNVVEGEDYVTLVTCTPYGVNTQRLLVRGHRVPYEEEKRMMQEAQTVHSVHTDYMFWIWTGLAVTVVCMLLCTMILKLLAKKKRAVGVMAFFLILSMSSVEVQAASPIEQKQACSLTVEIPVAYRSALHGEVIPVRLYRIADITENGGYTDLNGYEELELGKLSGSVTAAQLEVAAERTAAFLQADSWEEQPQTVPYKEFVIIDDRGVQNDILPGLYLVCVKPTQIGKSIYEAMPYIISLPCLFEESDGAGNRNQEWSYDVTIDLKLGLTSQPEVPPEPLTKQEILHEEPPLGSPEKMAYKTGDDTGLYPLIIGTAVTGIAFAVVCLLEKWKRRTKKEDGE